MEFSLHRQLKERYAGQSGKTEKRVDGFRIDAVAGGRLVEIQLGSLSAIRKKIETLVQKHRVLVVKPVVLQKTIVKLNKRGGQVVSRRLSPKRGAAIDIFEELMYFRHIFPHRNLTIESPLLEIEEWRYPGRNKRRRRRRQNDFLVEDRRLVAHAGETILKLRTNRDLHKFLPHDLPMEFGTLELAQRMGISRSQSQCIAYCLRHTGAAKVVRKQRNANVYRLIGKHSAKVA